MPPAFHISRLSNSVKGLEEKHLERTWAVIKEKLSATPDVRNELERMAFEYRLLADSQERRWPDADE